MNILIYFPTNKNSNSIETVVRHFCRSGHHVFFLSFDPEGPIHETVKSYGAKVYSYTIAKKHSSLFYLKHIFYLRRFILDKKIDIVYSHIQQPNLIAAIVQYFVSAKVILCRHHLDVAELTHNKKEMRADRLLKHLGKHFIAPSHQVYRQMIREGVQADKIHLIPYAYDFSKFTSPDHNEVERIKAQYPCHLRVIIISRYVEDKRYPIAFKAVERLIKEDGLDIKCICLGAGALLESYRNYLAEKDMADRVHLLGFQQNVQDYLAASDLMLHLSISEASNSAVKEAGLLGKAVIVREGVGDFDDYIVSGENGIKVPKQHPDDVVYETLKDIYHNREKYENMGAALRKAVYAHFSFEHIVGKYDDLHRSLLK